jgi:hypothetical protein
MPKVLSVRRPCPCPGSPPPNLQHEHNMTRRSRWKTMEQPLKLARLRAFRVQDDSQVSSDERRVRGSLTRRR